jgi:ABC-type multidrug transport system ATPase subunit
MNSLKLVDCSAGYPGNSALFTNLNQDFADGLYIVNGSNGSGKSTLFRTLAGVLKPISGTVTFNSLNMYNDAEARAQISYLPHRLGGQGSLRAGTYLQFWTDIRSQSCSSATRERLHAAFDIAELAERKLATLSRGQMQRVALLKSLSSPAKLFILDEPYAGLDVQYTDALTNEIRSLSENGAIVILSLHGPHALRELKHTEIDIAVLRGLTPSAPVSVPAPALQKIA